MGTQFSKSLENKFLMVKTSLMIRSCSCTIVQAKTEKKWPPKFTGVWNTMYLIPFLTIVMTYYILEPLLSFRFCKAKIGDIKV